MERGRTSFFKLISLRLFRRRCRSRRNKIDGSKGAEKEKRACQVLLV